MTREANSGLPRCSFTVEAAPAELAQWLRERLRVSGVRSLTLAHTSIRVQSAGRRAIAVVPEQLGGSFGSISRLVDTTRLLITSI